MHIHEAVEQAIKEDAMIIRSTVAIPEMDNYSAIKPTNSYDACLAIVIRAGKIAKGSRWWNPTADDLMASDWIVVKE